MKGRVWTFGDALTVLPEVCIINIPPVLPQRYPCPFTFTYTRKEVEASGSFAKASVHPRWRTKKSQMETGQWDVAWD